MNFTLRRVNQEWVRNHVRHCTSKDSSFVLKNGPKNFSDTGQLAGQDGVIEEQAPQVPTEEAGPQNVTFEDISRAELRIRNGIEMTDLKHSRTLSKMTGIDLFLKVDSRQITGSFKERGARNALMQLSTQQQQGGVICASAGNHALAMAYHGRDLGIDVTCVMPTAAPLTKVDNCMEMDANVILHGDHIGDAFDHAMQIRSTQGQTYINGFDHPHIIAGAGTMGLEILKQAPDVDAIVIPVGGAGLIAGVARAAKTLNPHVQIIAAEPKNCASFSAALAHGDVIKADVKPTLADGLAVPKVGLNAFHISKDLVDEVVIVEDSDIAIAVLRLLETEKLVVEGGGATGLAAILSGSLSHLHGKNVVVPLCGGNIDVTTLGLVIDRGLAADGRLIRFSVMGNDRPGGLARITNLIAECGACIKDVHHERAMVQRDIFYVENQFLAQVTGKDQSEKLKRKLLGDGWAIKWGDETWTEPTEDFINEELRHM